MRVNHTPRNPHWTIAEDLILIDMLKEGKTMLDIARRLKRTRSSVIGRSVRSLAARMVKVNLHRRARALALPTGHTPEQVMSRFMHYDTQTPVQP